MILLAGIICPLSCADYSIGTIIETTGPVRDSFSGTWQNADGNGTNISGVYTDSVMTNGGSISLNKQVSMTEGSVDDTGLEVQKVIGYNSGESGSHLIADEYLLSTYNAETNVSKGKVCFGEPYAASSCSSNTQEASFTIVNAKALTLSSTARTSSGTTDYSLQVGTPGNTSSNPGLEGTLITSFKGTSGTEDGIIQLYDRTLISGLIDTFSRIYQGGESIQLTGTSSNTGPIHDKTIIEQQFSKNDTSGELHAGTAVYAQDIMTNGGKTDETRQISGSGSISSERIISYQSEGDRSIQTSEHAVATRMQGTDSQSSDPSCVFAGQPSSTDTSSPYREASAETGFAGVSSAQMSSTTFISDPDESDELTLEYRADISIPIGFNVSFVEGMKDTDNDGRFEDLNGNGRLDMNDLVLLFHNFRWIGESNLSTRIDFNDNNRADYADIVTIFNSMNSTIKNS